MHRPAPEAKPEAQLDKAATGIDGLDEIMLGGLPARRPTLVCGAAGCGKTLFAMTFLVNGARLYDEPGVLLKRIVGTLSDMDRVLVGLDLKGEPGER
jgi:hypothetical protein